MESLLSEIFQHLQATFEPASLGQRLASLFSTLVVGASVALVYYVLWRIVRRALASLFKRTTVDPTARSFALLFTRYALLAIAVVHVLSAVGINTGALLTSLGVAGLTIGFAARDSLSNIISGLFIFWDRPFVIGDLVESGPFYGRVDDITLRSTRVITPDGRMLAIPNSEILNTTVASYTNFPNLRIDLDFQISVDENINRVRQLLLALVANDPDMLMEPPPVVVMTALGDYNNTVELRTWLKDERIHAEKACAVRERAYAVLSEAGVSMPFETLELRPVELLGPARPNA